MQQVLDALKARYNLSDEDAKKVLGVLVTAETKRQQGAGGEIRGMRGAGDSRIDAGDLLGIAGSLLGGGGQQSQGGGDILGSLLGGLLGGGAQQPAQQSSPDLMNVITDLIGGASHQGGGSVDLGDVLSGLLGGMGQQQSPVQQGGDPLSGLLGGLLGGGQTPAQQGGGADDLMNMLTGLLGGMGGAPGQAPTQQPGQGGQFYSPQDVQQPQKPPAQQGSGAQLGAGKPGKKDYGSLADAVDKMSNAVQKKPGKLGGHPAAQQKKPGGGKLPGGKGKK